MAIRVAPIATAAERKAFLHFPWRVYRGDPHWVPPMLRDVSRLIDPRVHPFHQHAEAEHFLAWRDGEPVGRIAACVNRLHNEQHHDRTAFFGFFETINDPEVARALFTAAEGFARARGMDRLRGPASYSVNEECGLLVEGFEAPPVVMMAYNPPWYRDLIEGCGFTKAMDLLAYDMPAGDLKMRGMQRVAERTMEKLGATVRIGDMKQFAREVELVRTTYNQAWSNNWGFVPITAEEIQFAAADLKTILDPRVMIFVEIGGRAVGCALGIPNINLILKHLNGRLFPFGWLKLLWGLRSIHSLRVIMLGTIPEYVNTGVAQILFYQVIRRGIDSGYPHAEMSWVLENNPAMCHTAERLGGTLYKRYRLFDRPVSP